MIRIQRREQFEKAAERLREEHMRVSRHEPGLYRVENLTRGHTYYVRVERLDGLTFGTCTCEAGTPSDHRRAPLVCKHLCAVVIYLRAVRGMRRLAAPA